MADTAQRGSPLLEGLRLPDRYEVRRRIATGGMASVWCADDRVLDRSVAIKLLSTPFAHDVSAVRRFKREARAAARLSSHPHVVTIYDVGHAIEVDEPIGRPFIVMEYLAGGTVADALRVRAVTRELAVRWLREAAAALDYAHGRGVIHRDIKPANLLLDGNRVLHVADFGIARLGTEETFSTTGQVMGTASYIAPEQVVGRPATEASDRYALAVAAFELLVGERPFTAEHFAAQARQHLEEEPPRASSRNGKLPGALDEVLMRGMAKRPEDRWPSAGQFADAVAHAVKARPVPAATAEAPTEATAPLGEARAPRRRPVPEALGRPAFVSKRTRSRRGPALAALAAGVIGVVVAAIASGALGGSGKPLTTSVARRSTAPAHVASTAHTAKPKKHAKRHSTTTATSTPSVTASPAAATATSATADTLQSQGHQLMEGGDYSRAIPLLQQAVSAASPGSLTYAYALYDLGRSLRLSGDPKAAIPVLYRRLQIPNQTETVRQELQLALRAVGAKVSQSGGGGSQGGGPAGHAKHGHGGGPSHGGSGD